ncbi:MAG: FtsX-like permease family protein [Bryobacteraceae bacterium]
MRFARTAERIAWRDLKASPGQWGFTVVIIALSFASLSGVRSAAVTVKDGLSHGSRQWLAADVSVSLDNLPDQDQLAGLDQLRSSGIDWTLVTSAMSTAASENSPDPVFAIVKAADPAAYPYYGQLLLDPPKSLPEALTEETTVVSEDILARLSVRTGDRIRIGAQFFRIAAVIRLEPDRFVAIPGAGMRCILSREGYARSGIARGGSSEFHRVLLRLPSAAALDDVLRKLETWFPGANIADYRDANPQFVWAVGTALSLLSLPPFLALVVGAFGIAIAVRAHVEQRLNMAAVLKMLGGRSAQIAAIFAMQIFAMVGIGILIGIPLGLIAKNSMLTFANSFAPFPAEGFSLREIGEGAGVALLAILPALVRPFLLIRNLSPAAVLRRNSEERTLERMRAPAGLKIVTVVAFGSFLLIGATMLRSWDSAAFILAAQAANAAAVWLFATVGLKLMRGIASSPVLAGSLRYGFASLYRPTNRSRALIVAVGTGLATLVGTFETHDAVARAIVETLPFDRANLLIADVDGSQSRSLPAVLKSVAGAEGEAELLNLAWIRLEKINGVELSALGTRGDLIPRQWLTSCETATSAPSGAIISSTTAKLTGAKIGSSIEFKGANGPFDVTVTAIRGVDPMQELWHSFTLDCRVLNGQSIFHDAAIRVRPDHLAAAARDLRTRYPALAVISAEDLAATVSDLTRQTEHLVRLLAWYTLAAGITVLIAIVVASRAARGEEIAMLRALGATRRWIRSAYLSEFAAVGFLAGLAGGLLTSGFESLLLSVIFHRPTIVFQSTVVVVSVVVSAVVAAGAAWIPVQPLLKRTPLEVLRRLRGA